MVQLGLIQTVQSPCAGLRYQQWYRISPGVRQYAYQLIGHDKVKKTLKTIVDYFLSMAEELSQIISEESEKRLNMARGVA